MRLADPAVFFDHVRAELFHGLISASQAAGTDAILAAWPDACDLRFVAYGLATAYHETAQTMQPIAEYGHGEGRVYGHPDPETGQVYYGRGLVQLTWKYNYERMSPFAGVDLVAEPERALEPAIAARIMVEGMTRGMFTGEKLADYFRAGATDWLGARAIVNGRDCAAQIATYAVHCYRAILAGGGDAALRPASLSVEKSGIDLATVAGLQAALNALGHAPPLAADGELGPSTEAAIRAFQARAGLSDDGIAGPRTQAAIRAALGG